MQHPEAEDTARRLEETSPEAGDAVLNEELSTLRSALEALLFVTPEPLSLDALCEALGHSDRGRVFQALCELQAACERDGRGLRVEEVAGGYRLVTKPACDAPIRKLLEAQSARRLSRAALETLAIVAYRQPVTTPEIEAVRGVDSLGVLKSLLDRRLVRMAGRKNIVGRPILWKTTREFLEHFGLKNLKELPRIEEFEGLFPPSEEEKISPLFGNNEEEAERE
jgi:segregation and condensation protein B